MTAAQRATARRRIRRYCERAELARAGIHYRQFRPMDHFGIPPEHGFTADCSGFATGAFYWADKWSAGFAVADPNGLGYSGLGYTGTLLAHNLERRVSLATGATYRIGDLALYGRSFSDTRHVVICRAPGSSNTAIWSSHGSEAGPYPVRLRYRADLLAVVRPRALA